MRARQGDLASVDTTGAVTGTAKDGRARRGPKRRATDGAAGGARGTMNGRLARARTPASSSEEHDVPRAAQRGSTYQAAFAGPAMASASGGNGDAAGGHASAGRGAVATRPGPSPEARSANSATRLEGGAKPEAVPTKRVGGI